MNIIQKKIKKLYRQNEEKKDEADEAEISENYLKLDEEISFQEKKGEAVTDFIISICKKTIFLS